MKTIGSELNVRYVLEGSVQRGGNRMRVNVQLIDAETGNHLWAERFDKPLTDLFDMQDEIVARLAGTLNAQLVAAEARRAEQAPTPDSMDLYFQGMARLNKGLTPDNVARARSFFDRALAADPDNVDALIGSAASDMRRCEFLCDRLPMTAFATAESKMTRALSSVPDHARAHMYLGLVDIWTKRAAEGIANCEHALALDRNLAHAHSLIGLGEIYIGRAEETEADIAEALRLSPRDAMAYIWMHIAGMAKNHLLPLRASGCVVSTGDRGQPGNYPDLQNFFLGAAPRGSLVGSMRRVPARSKAGVALNPAFTISRVRAAWSARSDDPTFLAGFERILEGMRKAGVPER